jgi:hypothetical protein
LFGVVLEGLSERREIQGGPAQQLAVPPHLLSQELRLVLVVGFAEHASQEDVPFSVLDVALIDLYLGGDEEREEQLILLEETPANVDVEAARDVLDDGTQTIVEFLASWARNRLETLLEEPNKELE